jgi:hypothetical protein
MVCKAKELSSEQREVIEALLGRPVAEDTEISIKAFDPDSAPAWLLESWEGARRSGLDQISMEEIDAEIKAAREDRRARTQAISQ